MHLIERLERQRHATGRIRAYVADPQRRFTRILCLYLTWLQTHVCPTHSQSRSPLLPRKLPPWGAGACTPRLLSGLLPLIGLVPVPAFTPGKEAERVPLP